MDKILIIRFSSFGDILLTSPTVRALYNKNKNCEIAFLTKEVFRPLVEKSPYISKVMTIKSGSINELFALRRKISVEYNIVIDLHKNIRSFVLTAGIKSLKVFRYKKNIFKRRVLAMFGINLFKNKILSVAERYLEAVKNIGAEDDKKGLEFFASEEAFRKAKDIVSDFCSAGVKPIILAPGSKWQTKQWPAEKYKELISSLNSKQFIILGDSSDSVVSDIISNNNSKNILNLVGKTDIQTAAEILRQSDLLITNDSGLMHLGCAVNIPIVAIFGSTVKEFGFFPFRANAIVLEKELNCRPCTTIGKSSCKKGTLECLNLISVDEVKNAIFNLQIFPAL